MSTLAAQRTVGELVAERPSRSRVFEKLGIDYCCGGRRPLAEACAAQGLDPATVARLLESDEPASNAPAGDPSDMTLSELADHIEQTHHAYLRTELPRLEAMIRKVAAVHGSKHPWLVELEEVFGAFVKGLRDHMASEEERVFPMIRALEGGDAAATSGDGLAGPLRAMEHEHDEAGAALATMSRITEGYRPPEGACNTFRAMLDALAELERDMHQHVHKENNVLFPRAEALT